MEGYAAVARSVPDRETLLMDHAPLVKKVAYRIVSRLPGSVDVEDLISAGMIGLLSAVDRYDPSKGAFDAFAEWRIKGAILDELRTYDHLTRTQRQKASKVDKARRKLEHKLGRPVLVEEIAEEAGFEQKEAEQALEVLDGPGYVSLDELGVERENVEEILSAMVQRPGIPSPLQHAMLQETKTKLVEVLATLKEREQTILSLYYVDELNYREIGEVMELTESRICQIVRKALKTIAKRMQDY